MPGHECDLAVLWFVGWGIVLVLRLVCFFYDVIVSVVSPQACLSVEIVIRASSCGPFSACCYGVVPSGSAPPLRWCPDCIRFLLVGVLGVFVE